MSDNQPPDTDPAGRDPVDKAYVQAESMLDDEAARTDRRAAVLAAVARERAAEPAPPPARALRHRLDGWRYAAWLPAACIAGLSVFVALRLYPPIGSQAPTAPAPSTEPSMSKA